MQYASEFELWLNTKCVVRGASCVDGGVTDGRRDGRRLYTSAGSENWGHDEGASGELSRRCEMRVAEGGWRVQLGRGAWTSCVE